MVSPGVWRAKSVNPIQAANPEMPKALSQTEGGAKFVSTFHSTACGAAAQ
jgi:hypothetical protein